MSIAVITCRAGRIQGGWNSLVNPGVPITPETTAVHGLRDPDVAGAPDFAAVAGMLLASLTPGDGETLVVVAHNARFDIPVVRNELTAVGLSLPHLPVLDTMRRLPALAGVTPATGGLTDLLDVLGIINTNPHDARADAEATAAAVIELLNRAADAGHASISQLLAAAGATTRLRGRTRITGTRTGPVLPVKHLAGHATVLPARPAARTLTQWTTKLVECATLRCPHAADRINQTQAPSAVTIPALLSALRRTTSAGDDVGTATLLWAAGGLLERVGDHQVLRRRRTTATGVYDHLAALTDGVPRCGTNRTCPACADGQPCGMDTWTYHLAGAALGRWDHPAVKSFFPLTGPRASAKSGPWATWTTSGRGTLADAALLALLRVVHRQPAPHLRNPSRHRRVAGRVPAPTARPGLPRRHRQGQPRRRPRRGHHHRRHHTGHHTPHWPAHPLADPARPQIAAGRPARPRTPHTHRAPRQGRQRDTHPLASPHPTPQDTPIPLPPYRVRAGSNGWTSHLDRTLTAPPQRQSELLPGAGPQGPMTVGAAGSSVQVRPPSVLRARLVVGDADQHGRPGHLRVAAPPPGSASGCCRQVRPPSVLSATVRLVSVTWTRWIPSAAGDLRRVQRQGVDRPGRAGVGADVEHGRGAVAGRGEHDPPRGGRHQRERAGLAGVAAGLPARHGRVRQGHGLPVRATVVGDGDVTRPARQGLGAALGAATDLVAEGGGHERHRRDGAQREQLPGACRRRWRPAARSAHRRWWPTAAAWPGCASQRAPRWSASRARRRGTAPR